MKPSAFEYASPTNLADVIRLLAENDGAKIMSGGQSLMPMMAFRLAAPSLIVDLKNVQGLGEIGVDADGVTLGARVRWVDIENDHRLHQAHPLLAEAIKHVAHYQVRNRGTVGGSLSHADPAAEMPGVAMTCDAQMEIAGPRGTRRVAADEFFRGSLETATAEDEILVALRLPAWRPGRKWAFKEFSRRRGDFAIAGTLIYFDEEADGTIADAHVGAIGIGDRPHRLTEAEAVLNGQHMSAELIEQTTSVAAAILEPSTDMHATADYRRSLYCTLLGRALQEAHERRESL